ncbi:MAG: transposase [Planctomycetota bacterium]
MEAMRAEAVGELSDPKLRQPCRKVLESLQEHWTGLLRFVDDPRVPMDNNASERAGRGPAVARKNRSPRSPGRLASAGSRSTRCSRSKTRPRLTGRTRRRTGEPRSRDRGLEGCNGDPSSGHQHASPVLFRPKSPAQGVTNRV